MQHKKDALYIDYISERAKLDWDWLRYEVQIQSLFKEHEVATDFAQALVEKKWFDYRTWYDAKRSPGIPSASVRRYLEEMRDHLKKMEYSDVFQFFWTFPGSLNERFF